MQIVGILVVCQADFWAFQRSSCRRLRKWFTNGTTRARWFRRPIFDSNSLALTFPFPMVSLIMFVHAVNFFAGREMMSLLRSQSQQRMVFVSDRAASAFSFFFDIICWQGIGSSAWTGWLHAWIARRGALSARWTLSVFGKSMVSPIMLLMYISWIPWLLMGILIANSFPSVKGMSSGRKIGGGTRCWREEKRFEGSQNSSWLISVARLQIVSEIILHSKGHAAPP